MRATLWPTLTIGIAGLLIGPILAQDLTPQEARGRGIYFTGASPSGSAIVAVLGNDGVEVPAASVPCAGCHGRDGRGRPEGGVTPSDIRWSTLSQRRPPYGDSLLIRAFTMGLGTGGTLNAVMPRYRISASDARDLVAWLKILGMRADPGIFEDSLRVGAILPPPNFSAPGMGRAVRDALSAWFEDLGHRELIYGRRIDLRFLELPDDVSRRAAAVRTFVRDQGIFCFVSGFLAGSEEAIGSTLEDLEVPLIGALAPWPQASNRYVFYLDGGVPLQAEALAAYALSAYAGGKPPIAIIHSGGGAPQRLAETLVERFRGAGWPEVRRIETGGSARPLKPPADLLLVLSREASFREFASRSGVGGSATTFLVPGALLTPDALDGQPAAGIRLLAAYPILPSDYSAAALSEYQSVAEAHHLSRSHFQAQLAALCGAKILTEALHRAGRDLSRDKLVDVLEDLRDFETGWSPPISFGSNRRSGILQPRMVEVDFATRRMVPEGAGGKD
jgi:mono/diheme cytochrome c family protein